MVWVEVWRLAVCLGGGNKGGGMYSGGMVVATEGRGGCGSKHGGCRYGGWKYVVYMVFGSS